MTITAENIDFQARKLPKAWLDYIYENGLFKLFIPKEYGGLEKKFSSACKILIETAAFNGSYGWVINLGAGAGYFCGFLPPSSAQEIYGPSTAVVAGSGRMGEAELVNDTLIVSGKWSKASGAAHATHFSANVELENGECKTVFIPRETLTLTDDWEAFALKASSSYTFEANRIKIPLEHSYLMGLTVPVHPYSIYKIPFIPFAKICLFSTIIGLTKGFIQEAKAIDLVSPRVQDLNTHLQEMEAFILKEAEDFELNPTKNEATLAPIPKYAKELFLLVQELFFEAGLQSVKEESPFFQRYLDVNLGLKHGMLRK